jgi:hypothetical protein
MRGRSRRRRRRTPRGRRRRRRRRRHPRRRPREWRRGVVARSEGNARRLSDAPTTPSRRRPLQRSSPSRRTRFGRLRRSVRVTPSTRAPTPSRPSTLPRECALERRAANAASPPGCASRVVRVARSFSSHPSHPSRATQLCEIRFAFRDDAPRPRRRRSKDEACTSSKLCGACPRRTGASAPASAGCAP